MCVAIELSQQKISNGADDGLLIIVVFGFKSKKTGVKVGLPLTKLSGPSDKTFWIRACILPICKGFVIHITVCSLRCTTAWRFILMKFIMLKMQERYFLKISTLNGKRIFDA